MGIKTGFKAAAGVSFFPVPAREKISIETHGQVFNKMEITDLYGKTIQSRCDVISDNYSVNLNIPEGFYFIRLSGENGEVTGKILVE